MSWAGTLRTIQAAERRAQRDAQRRFKELQRRAKEQAKLSALEQARLEVESNENQLELLLSMHKEQAAQWDWNEVLNSPPPAEPVRGTGHQASAEARQTAYRPGFFDKLFGKAEKMALAFEIQVQKAQERDEQEFQAAWSQCQQDWVEWQAEYSH